MRIMAILLISELDRYTVLSHTKEENLNKLLPEFWEDND